MIIDFSLQYFSNVSLFKGKPKPAVYWLKDGVRLREPDDNHIVTQEGHLILVTARQQDAGNYTCVAENLAAKRYSKPAEISIFGKYIFLQI